jgi:hypothetical protein
MDMSKANVWKIIIGCSTLKIITYQRKIMFLVTDYCVSFFNAFIFVHPDTVEPGYNNIGLRDTSSIASDILWYQLIPHC